MRTAAALALLLPLVAAPIDALRPTRPPRGHLQQARHPDDTIATAIQTVHTTETAGAGDLPSWQSQAEDSVAFGDVTVDPVSQAANPIDTFVSPEQWGSAATVSASAALSDISDGGTDNSGSVSTAEGSPGYTLDGYFDGLNVSAGFGGHAAWPGHGIHLGPGELGPPANPHSPSGKLVFARFMIGIVYGYTLDDWVADIQLAKSYGIDGWALNIGVDSYTEKQLDLAYQASAQANFSCFISFDFNWYKLVNVSGVADMMRKYKDHPAQLRVDGKPFVSTFVGDGFDWSAVAQQVGEELYAVPFWQPTQDNANDKGLSGLFSWAAWPGQLDNIPIDASLTTERDETYLSVLNQAGRKYMAPVSTWFFTHFGKEVPWSKNWLFKSEALWKTRWEQVLAMGDKLDFVEIVTWNDYGESHNVSNWGGNHSDDGSSKWSEGLDHLPMLDLSLPYIKAWKAGLSEPVVEKDQVVYWYRPHSKAVNCDATDNFGSKPTGWDFVADTIFVATMTRFGGSVRVTSGSNPPVVQHVGPGVQLVEVPMGVGNQSFEFYTLAGGYHATTSKVAVSDKCWPTKDFAGIYNYNYHAGLLDCE
ncbi:hypothetical protein IAU60_003527 [Kwoniella sp. DSM 27419]